MNTEPEHNIDNIDRPWENNGGSSKDLAIFLLIVAILIALITYICIYASNLYKQSELATYVDAEIENMEDNLNLYLYNDPTDDSFIKNLVKDVVSDNPEYEYDNSINSEFNHTNSNTITVNSCKITLGETTLGKVEQDLNTVFSSDNTMVHEEDGELASSTTYVNNNAGFDISGVYNKPNATIDNIKDFVVTDIIIIPSEVESFNFYGITQETTKDDVVSILGNPYEKTDLSSIVAYSWISDNIELNISFEDGEIVSIWCRDTNYQ